MCSKSCSGEVALRREGVSQIRGDGDGVFQPVTRMMSLRIPVNQALEVAWDLTSWALTDSPGRVCGLMSYTIHVEKVSSAASVSGRLGRVKS